jgi:hypothetical protein
MCLDKIYPALTLHLLYMSSNMSRFFRQINYACMIRGILNFFKKKVNHRRFKECISLVIILLAFTLCIYTCQ